MGNIERWECVECGKPVPDERGHVHVRTDDAYTCAPTRHVVYVPASQLAGAVSVDTAVEALTDALVDYNVPTGRIVAEFKRLVADYVSGGQ